LFFGFRDVLNTCGAEWTLLGENSSEKSLFCAAGIDVGWTDWFEKKPARAGFFLIERQC
jgi:hypothetical protein